MLAASKAVVAGGEFTDTIRRSRGRGSARKCIAAAVISVQRNVDIGSRVKAGDPLAVISAPMLAAMAAT
jgi:hypothetical protein